MELTEQLVQLLKQYKYKKEEESKVGDFVGYHMYQHPGRLGGVLGWYFWCAAYGYPESDIQAAIDDVRFVFGGFDAQHQQAVIEYLTPRILPAAPSDK